MDSISVQNLHVQEIKLINKPNNRLTKRIAEKELNIIQDKVLELEIDFCHYILNTPFSYDLCYRKFEEKFRELFFNIKNAEFIFFDIDINYFQKKYHYSANVFK